MNGPGIDWLLSPEDLRDLLAYLLSDPAAVP